MESSNAASYTEGRNPTEFLICRIPFPDVVQEKISTKEFLEASAHVVVLVEKLGKIFAPVKYDMQGNIAKLNTRFATDPETNSTLQDMILKEHTTEKSLVAADALVWLTRTLHLILRFFEKILEDSKTSEPSEDLVAILKNAYKETLEPYHGWMTQQLFGLVARATPTRTALLRTLADGCANYDDEAVLREIECYLPKLRVNVLAIQEFYRTNDLDNRNLLL